MTVPDFGASIITEQSTFNAELKIAKSIFAKEEPNPGAASWKKFIKNKYGPYNLFTYYALQKGGFDNKVSDTFIATSALTSLQTEMNQDLSKIGEYWLDLWLEDKVPWLLDKQTKEWLYKSLWSECVTAPKKPVSLKSKAQFMEEAIKKSKPSNPSKSQLFDEIMAKAAIAGQFVPFENYQPPKEEGSIMQGDSAPVDKYMAAMQAYSNPNAIVAEIKKLDEVEKHHQTLVVCVASKNTSEYHRERMTRFVTSLNTNATIKADVITLRPDDKAALGLSFQGEPVDKVSYSKIKKLVKTGGWGQLVFLEEGVKN